MNLTLTIGVIIVIVVVIIVVVIVVVGTANLVGVVLLVLFDAKTECASKLKRIQQ